MGGVVENGYTYPRSSPHLEIKPAISRSGTPPVLIEKDAVNTGPQTPPWPHPQESKPSSSRNSHLSSDLEAHLLAGALSSGVAEERLVNGVPIAEANDSARGGTSSPKELIAGPSEHNVQPRRKAPSSSPRYSQARELRSAPALQEINTNDLVMNSERSSSLSSPTHTPPLPHTSPLSSP